MGSNGPTGVPTDAPTDAPTNAPTDAPTEAPTEVPTEAPTDCPRYTFEESFCDKPVMSADACEEAARCFEKTYDNPMSKDTHYLPNGCFAKNRKIRFNDNGTYGTKCSSKKKCVCYL